MTVKYEEPQPVDGEWPQYGSAVVDPFDEYQAIDSHARFGQAIVINDKIVGYIPPHMVVPSEQYGDRETDD